MNHAGQTILFCGIYRPHTTARLRGPFAQPGGLSDSSRGLSAATAPVMVLKQPAPRRGARCAQVDAGSRGVAPLFPSSVGAKYL